MTLSWITGLMRQNYDAIGFIPETTIRDRYLAYGRYVIQVDERGRNVGYILHGKSRPGGVLTIAQHCIDMDRRLHGYGEQAFNNVLERAQIANCRAIVLKCAEDLPANSFWQAVGFERTNTLIRENKRQRAINVYTLDLWPMLWEVTQ